MDAHVQRAQLLGDDALEVGLGEPGERRVVPVEERQPVVVVLHVEAATQAGRQLVDEAELAVVVAGAHLIEERRVHLDAERLPRTLGDLDGQREPAAHDLELELGLVGEQLPLDHVARDLAVEDLDTVADQHPRDLGRRAGREQRRLEVRTSSQDRVDTVHLNGRGPRAARVAPGVLRRRRDGDQGAGVDGALIRAAGVLLPRDRPQPAGGAAVRGLRAWCSSTRSRDVPDGTADHAVRPRLRARGRRRGRGIAAGSSSTRSARS